VSTTATNQPRTASGATMALLWSIVAMDAFAFTLVLPLLPVFLKNEHTSTWLIVLIFASFSVCQFFAAPHLGRLADRFGRKRVLLLSQVGTLIGFLLLAWAPSPAWMLPSRVVDGITAGNLAIVNAVICDMYDDKERSGAFARLNSAGAVGVMLGLGTAAIFAHQSLAHLALGAAIAALGTVLLGLFTPFPARQVVSEHLSLRQVSRRFPALRRPSVAVVVSQLVMTALMTVMTLLLTEVLDYDARKALILVLIGLLIGGTIQAVVAGPLEKALGTRWAVAVAVAMLILGTVLFALTVTTGVAGVYGVAAAVVVLSGGSLLLMSTATALLSQSASVGAGLLMGINQSLSALGQLAGPALGLLVLSFGWTWLMLFLVAASAVALVVLNGRQAHD
jgi:MFS family permease